MLAVIVAAATATWVSMTPTVNTEAYEEPVPIMATPEESAPEMVAALAPTAMRWPR